jgi:large subunit ribosomal protein L29
MKLQELREKTKDQLQTELTASLRELFNLRMQKGMGQPPKSHLFKSVRLNIARIKTILHEKG